MLLEDTLLMMGTPVDNVIPDGQEREQKYHGEEDDGTKDEPDDVMLPQPALYDTADEHDKDKRRNGTGEMMLRKTIDKIHIHLPSLYERVTGIIDTVFRAGVVLDAKAALLDGGTVRTEGKSVVSPETVPVLRVVTRIILGTPADTADAGNGLGSPAVDILDIIGIAVIHAVHKLRLGILPGVQDENALAPPLHDAGLAVRGMAAGKDHDAGVRITHRVEVLDKTVDGLPVGKHPGELLRGEDMTVVLLPDTEVKGDLLPNVRIVTPVGMTEIIDLVAALAQLPDQRRLASVTPAGRYINS